MPRTLEHVQLCTEARCDLAEEPRALDLGAPDLEMRVARAAQRPRAEHRPAQVRTATASSRDDALGRRSSGRCEESSTPARCSVSYRVLRPLDVELVPRCMIERVLLVRADLRLDSNARRRLNARRARQS